MKKIHIFLLIAVATGIAVMFSFWGNMSTYSSVLAAQKQEGKFVRIIASLDRTQPVMYDPLKDPNFCTFSIVDSLGGTSKVISHKPKPADLDKSERIVLQGKMQADGFHCDDILLKCPSKYKDDMKAASKELEKTVNNQ